MAGNGAEVGLLGDVFTHLGSWQVAMAAQAGSWIPHGIPIVLQLVGFNITFSRKSFAIRLAQGPESYSVQFLKPKWRQQTLPSETALVQRRSDMPKDQSTDYREAVSPRAKAMGTACSPGIPQTLTFLTLAWNLQQCQISGCKVVWSIFVKLLI